MTKLIFLASAALALSGCMTTRAVVANDIPPCERLIPASLITPVEGTDIPVPENWPDGHEKAEPWQLGYLGQTGQLDKANEKAPAVDHIYRECLKMHADALKRSQRGFFGRLFGG